MCVCCCSPTLNLTLCPCWGAWGRVGGAVSFSLHSVSSCLPLVAAAHCCSGGRAQGPCLEASSSTTAAAASVCQTAPVGSHPRKPSAALAVVPPVGASPPASSSACGSPAVCACGRYALSDILPHKSGSDTAESSAALLDPAPLAGSLPVLPVRYYSSGFLLAALPPVWKNLEKRRMRGCIQSCDCRTGWEDQWWGPTQSRVSKH